MGEDIQNNKTINNNTQITFTVKGFFATIGSILAIFFVFYQLVVLPRIETTEEHYREIFQDQKAQNRIFYDKINNMNNSIGALNTSITSLNQRFRDLNQNLNTYSNSGGSFGDVLPNEPDTTDFNIGGSERNLTDNN